MIGQDREAMRQAKFRTQFWPDDMMQFVDAGAASDYAGIKLPMGGVLHPYGRVIDPTLLTRFLPGTRKPLLTFTLLR